MAFMADDFVTNATEPDGNTFTFFGPLNLVLADSEKFQSNPLKWSMSILLSILMMTSIFGNLCTCTVIIKFRSMRTPTNWYLFNLAVTDLFVSFSTPLIIHMIWNPFHYPFDGCYFQLFIFYGITNCGILTISAITIERYLVVSKPFLQRHLSDSSRVLKIIIVIWLVSCCFCIPELWSYGVVKGTNYVFCYAILSPTYQMLVVIQQLVFFILPMGMIIVLYVLIAIKITSASPDVHRNSNTDGRDRAVMMLAAVAASFIFCMSPYVVFRLTTILMPLEKYTEYYPTWRILNAFSLVNGMLSTTMNPLLTFAMSQNFRQAYYDIFKRKSKTERNELATAPI